MISKVSFAHFELIGPEGDNAGFDTARAETDHRNTDEGNRPEVSINHHSFEVIFNFLTVHLFYHYSLLRLLTCWESS